MPDLILHRIFAEDVINKLQNSTVAEGLNRDSFYLGAQGPDFIFYYRLLKKNDNLNPLGERIHKEKTGLLFSQFFENLLKLKKNNNPHYQSVRSYLLGLITHYTLDLTTHPYIVYSTGFSSLNNSDTKRYQYYHKQFETYCDKIILLEKKGLNIDNYRKDLLIPLQPLKQGIPEFTAETFSSVYETRIEPRQTAKAVKDMKSVLRLLYDPHGLKFRLFHFLESFLIPRYTVTKGLTDPTVDEDIDFFNRRHKEWLHPCDNEEKHSESLDDLIRKALEKAAETIQLSDEILLTENTGKLPEIFTDLSFETGKPCGIPLKFHDCVFDKSG